MCSSDLNGFFGFPYGPDVSLDLIAVTFETRRVLSELRLEYIRQGSYRIDDYYGEPFEFDWYRLAEPITRSAKVSLDFHYSPDENQEIFLSASALIGNKTEFCFKIGYGRVFRFLRF